MLKNYFVIASRSLVKHKFFSIINIIGLAVGMSICLLFIAFFSFIWRYDEFHENKDFIYRIISKTDVNAEKKEWASAPSLLAGRLKNGYAGIDQVVRISSTLSGNVDVDNREVPLSGYYVDANFLKVFTFPLLKGNIEQALVRPNTLVITEKAAKKLYGDADPMGALIQMNNKEFEITGVLEDHPKNSHMQFESLASYQSLEIHEANDQSENLQEFRNEYVYLQLPPGADTHQIELYLNDFANNAKTNTDFAISFKLQKLTDIAPGRILSNSIGPDWDYASLGGFIFIALLILIPASFNYANISIAQSLTRIKEIGVRKVMGGLQKQVFFQFIIETVIISFLALGLAFYLFKIVRQEFLSMLVSADAISLDLDGWVIFSFLVFALMVGVATGFVPAYYFSRIDPIQAMKKKPLQNTSGIGIRKSLTVFQFTLSLGFITSVIIMLSQYKQTINYDFGFEQKNILDVQLQGTDPELFKNEFSKLSSVSAVSMSSHILGVEGSESTYLKTTKEQDSVKVSQMYIDEGYIPNLNLTLIAGKNFTDTKISEHQIIVNEEFLKDFQIANPTLAIGSVVLLEDRDVEIIGVVKNFHYALLSEPINSFIFRYNDERLQVANIKVASSNILHTLTLMDDKWRMLAGEEKFTAKFFDEEMEDAYAFYFTMVKICGFLGFLAITISCLGLLGMVVLTAENRTKEVGIRKVLGASTIGIVTMLSRDFIKLIVIATCIALPLTYLFFDLVYLRMQYYKIPIGAGEMIAGVTIILALGLVTILSQTTRTARTNPVDILRCE